MTRMPLISEGHIRVKNVRYLNNESTSRFKVSTQTGKIFKRILQMLQHMKHSYEVEFMPRIKLRKGTNGNRNIQLLFAVVGIRFIRLNALSLKASLCKEINKLSAT